MKKTNMLPAGLALGLLLLTGCKGPEAQQKTAAVASAPVPVAEKAVPKGVGIDVANIDKSVAPCQDFFQYVNGNWIKNNPVPASESYWTSFHEVVERNNAHLRQILTEAAAANAPKGSNLQKVGDFYFSGMDSVGIQKAGLTPIQPELARIGNIKNLTDLQAVVENLHQQRISPLFSAYVSIDSKNSTQYALYMGQGGTNLPDRDYYLKDDKRSQNIRQEYEKYLRNLFQLLGDPEKLATANAAKVLAIETQLAQASKPQVELRDPHANYNKISVQELDKRLTNLNLTQLLQQMQLGAAKEVIVGQPEFFTALNGMLKTVPLADWKAYLRIYTVNSLASSLPSEYEAASFNFFSKTLRGAKEMQPRWKRMISRTDGALGEALGQLFVEKTFSPEAKEKAKRMIANLRLAFAEHVKDLDWMSAETKAMAMKKLDAFGVKIGYPDKWKDYSKLEITRGPYVRNVLASRRFSYTEMATKLGKPIDKLEWGMSPPTVNAYYSATKNEIVFPAGILQPPFFDANADDAVNYGGMGAVIGHELTHGFDDQGRKFDAEGNLKEWWTEADAAKFAARAEMVEKQYGAYQPLDSVYVNGKLTLGENIADIGGLNIAFTALQKERQGKEDPMYDGFTQNQRFFLSWAQAWRVNSTPEFLRNQVLTDPHSPGQFRTNGPLSNMPQFYEAFGCKPTDAMVTPPEKRIHIW